MNLNKVNELPGGKRAGVILIFTIVMLLVFTLILFGNFNAIIEQITIGATLSSGLSILFNATSIFVEGIFCTLSFIALSVLAITKHFRGGFIGFVVVIVITLGVGISIERQLNQMVEDADSIIAQYSDDQNQFI